MPTVTFGDVTFDPVELQDFRMSIEGASKTGKTNTVAVALEDLEDVAMPMLVIDEVGSLSTVRNVDDNIITVGAPGYDSVQVNVPADQLELVANLIYEEGHKVLLAANTYESEPEEPSREHQAVANALSGLFSKAKDAYMGGQRRKVLVFIDEAHVLCPEKGQDLVDVDEQVRRARAEIVQVATKGGNYGLNAVLAYQRRAYIAKGALTQVNNWVVHGLEAGDRKTAAKQLNIDEEEIQALDVGEALIYGTITDRQVVGPTQVRKRTSPDPREEQFSLPETPPDLEGVIEGVQDQIEDRAAREQERREEIERLQERLEEKDERIDELEQEVNQVDALRRAFERAAEGEGDGVPAEVTERIDDLQEELESERAAREEAEDKVDELRERLISQDKELEEAEARIQELESLEAMIDEAEGHLRAALQAIGREDPDAADAQAEVQELRDMLQERDEKIEQLEQRLEEGGDVHVPTDYQEFVDDDIVQEQIEEAKEEANTSPRYVKGVVATILKTGEPVTRQQVADHLGIKSKSDVSKAASALEARKVITPETDGQYKTWDFNTDGIREIKEAAQRRAETEEIIENL